MLRLALGLMMLATASATICGQLKDGSVVTAVSYITRNAAPPAGTDTPVVGKVKMTQSVRWLEQSILPRSHGLPSWKDHENEQFGGPICMSVYISGLPPCSTHGFHIHEGNDTITDDGSVVTAVSYITRNAAPPAGTDTPVVGKVKMTQSVRWLEQSILPRSHGLPSWKDHENEQFGGPICMSVYISGLPPCSTHGFHIHEGNDTITDGCQSTRGHYNPFKKTHGGPQDLIRHVGDLGNLKSDYLGVINTVLSDHVISLVGPFSVIGRAFVIHQKEDDLGRGIGPAKAESLITGNAGARLGCGVIFHDPIN